MQNLKVLVLLSGSDFPNLTQRYFRDYVIMTSADDLAKKLKFRTCKIQSC